jgi:hypothetical protein
VRTGDRGHIVLYSRRRRKGEIEEKGMGEGEEEDG